MPSRQSWLDRAALVRSEGMAAISEMVPPRWFTPDFITRQPAAVAFVMDMLHGTDPVGYAGCGEAIADKRLEALPFARYCIDCQRAVEEEERTAAG